MKIRRLAPVALAAVMLTACGGGGGDDSASSGAPVATDAAATGTEAPAADSGSSSGGGGGGGGLFGGAASFAKNLKFALSADSAEAVDDTTINVTFTDGTVADAESKCAIAKMSISPDIAVHLIYPDGEADC